MEENKQNEKVIDLGYAEASKEFLTWAIVNLVCVHFPVGSIICMNKAKKLRKDLIAYIEDGHPHTIKLKVASALYRATSYAGIAYTIIYFCALVSAILYLIAIGLIGAGLIITIIEAFST